jgi:hypothetical protein
MSSFDDREKGFEAKYKVDQELQFKAMARRNKLLGQWAAERMGLAGADVDTYAGSVVAADFAEPGDADVLAKVLADLNEKGATITEGELRKKMDELLTVARVQLEEE